MRRSEAFPSKFMSKDDVVPGRYLTISQVVQEGIESDGELKQKAVMYFQEHDVKPWIINAGNWMTIEDAYGEESDNWTGRPIELFIDPSVMFGGKRVGGVRVRIPATQPAKGRAQPAPSKDAVVTVQIQRVQISDGWYGISTDRGMFVTDDAEVGMDIQALGNSRAVFTYFLTPRGKQKVTGAALAGEPVADEPVEAEDDIPF